MPNALYDTLRNTLMSVCIGIQPLDGPLTVIWTDTDPCFMTPDSGSVLHKLRIVLVIGKVKSQNKNPVAELERELFQQDP